MSNLKKITNKIFIIFSILFGLTFFVSIIGTMLIPSNSKFENPIIKAGHIQVNLENVQIYNSAYKCIQTYDLRGNFISKTKIPYDILSSHKSTIEIINEYPFEAKIITKTQSIYIKQSIWRYFTFPITSWIILVCCWIPFLMLNTKELLTRIFNYIKS
jgi:hypothetical protein